MGTLTFSNSNLVLPSGTRLYANHGILGLSLAETDDSLYQGYDGEAWIVREKYTDPDIEGFSQEDRREIASLMIERWKKWGGI